MKSTIILEKIFRFSIYILAGLIPLWFLPITQDVLNFQKQMLLLVLVIVAVVAWFAKTVSEGELNIRLSWLHIPVLVLVLVTAISTATSIWFYGSFWGWPLNVSDSFLTIFVFALLYFLISGIVQDNKELSKVFSIFIVSSIIAGIYAILQLYNIFIIPFQFAKVATFNTIGSTNIVAILAATLLPLTLVMAFALKEHKRIFYILTVLLLAIMLLINFSNAWIVLIAGLLVLLTFGIWNLKKVMEFGWISFPTALLIIALFFLVFRFSLPGTPAVPVEVSPSRGAEISMLKNVLQKSPIFGTGPGTFVYDYAKYHQLNLNQTIFWGTRFVSGASEILDWFVTKGILGGLAFVALIITAIVLTFRMLLKPNEDSFSWMIQLGILASFVGITVAQIVYYSNFTLLLLFWLLLGGLGMFVVKSQKKISIAPPSFLSIVSSFIFLLVLILGVGFILVGGQKYIAEVQYLRGSQLVSKGQTDNGITKILSAVKLNPSVDFYWRNLSQLYLSQLPKIQADKSLSDEQRKQQIQITVDKSTSAVNQAVAINPANVENWNVRGFVYRSLIGAQGADIFAIESYNKAHDLEPSSPFSFTELGRVYLAQAQSLTGQRDTADRQEEALNNALEALNKAIELKSDYAPAHYLIALVYSQQGKSDQSIAKLDDTAKVAPNDVGLAFQLGVIYYQKNQFNKAQYHLERAKALNSDYANARYMLGLVYDKQGQENKAIEEFTKVLELNPDNDQVKKILDNLNDGEPALTGIQTTQPPIQENPSEIKK